MNDPGMSENELLELEGRGLLLPVNQTPVVRPDLAPRAAPPAAQQQPPQLVGSLPANLQLQPDIERTAYGGSVPTFRLMPVAPAGTAANYAPALKAVSHNAENNSAPITNPSGILTTTGDNPVTSTGASITIDFTVQSAGEFLASPAVPDANDSYLDQVVNAANTSGQPTTTASIGPITTSQIQTEWALLVVGAVNKTGGSTPGLFTVPASWISLSAAGPSGLAPSIGRSWSQIVPGGSAGKTQGTVSFGGITGPVTSDWCGSLLTFFTESGKVTTAQSQFSSSNITSNSLFSAAFASNTMAGNSIIVIVFSSNTSGAASFANFTDTQGNQFVQIAQSTTTNSSSFVVTTTVFLAQDIVGGADTITFTPTNAGTSGNPGLVFLAEISGLANSSGQPTFRNIAGSDLADAVFGASGVGHSAGAVPDPGAVAGTSRVLHEDGTWGNVEAIGQFNSAVNSGNVSVSGGVQATLVSLSATAPSSGGPWRALLTWNVNCANNFGGSDTGNFWVSDGTHTFAGLQTSIPNVNTGASGFGISPTTYANGASVTFNLELISSNSGTVNAAVFHGSGPNTGMQVVWLPSN
jgi:hypothetical protein